MSVKYDNLWELIAKKGMTRSQLRYEAGISTNAMVKLGKNESVQIEVLSKICSTLNCTFDDIVENTGDDALICNLPEIQFEDFDYGISKQFETLGLKTLEDFPYPHTVKSFTKTLTQYFRECKLSLGACEVLISALSESGIKIQLLSNVFPDEKCFPKYIPESDEGESKYELKWQQVKNYVDWCFRQSACTKNQVKNILKRAEKLSSTKKSILLEYGQIHADIERVGIIYYGITHKFLTTAQSYPFNLISNIFGYSCCYLQCQVKEMRDTVENLLDTLLPNEVLVLKMFYQYGLNVKDVVSLLDLPDFDSIKSVIRTQYLNRALRKLRHPSRSRKLNSYILESPLEQNRQGTEVYDSWVDNIITNVKGAICKSESLNVALEPFYDNKTISWVDSRSANWREIPEVSVDEMNFGWKLRMVLKQAKLTSLSDLWNAHGIGVSLKNFNDSGLNKYDFDTSQIEEILYKMGSYELLPIHTESVDEIINQIETMLSGEPKTPSLVCCAVPIAVLKHLLRLKYRTISSVISAFRSGVLQNQLKLYSCLSSEKEVILTVAQHLSDGKYDTILYIGENYWTRFLQDNPSLTITDIRQAYMNDESINCNNDELEKNISTLFPGNQPVFEALHKIRYENHVWKRKNIEKISSDLVSKILSITNSDEVLKAYFPDYYLKHGRCRLLIVEVGIAEKSQIYLFELAINGNLLLINSNIDELNCLWKIVQFTSELSGQEDFDILNPCDFPIEDLDLGCRAYSLLKRANILTIGEIVSKSYDELRSIKNMNRKCLFEIIEKAHNFKGVTIEKELMDIVFNHDINKN